MASANVSLPHDRLQLARSGLPRLKLSYFVKGGERTVSPNARTTDPVLLMLAGRDRDLLKGVVIQVE